MKNSTNLSTATSVRLDALTQHKAQNAADTEKLSLWEILYVLCHFLPILTSLSMLIMALFSPADFIANYILLPVAVIGWVAALIAKPWAIIKTIFSKSWAVFKFFFALPFFLVGPTTAIVFGAVTFGLLTMVAVFAPAVFTIYFFLKD